MNMATSALCPRSERIGGDLCHIHVGSENRFKRRRQKTVTWPIDQKICEVRHFVVDDAPSSLGAAVQGTLQCMQGKGLSCSEAQRISRFDVLGAKRARVEHDNVPPGFGPPSIVGKSRQLTAELDVAMAVTCPWLQPRKFLLDASWLWAGGEESSEVASQQQRERRFFEAFYPRLASIPDSPMEPQEPSKEIDDALVAQIPLVPLEVEEIVKEDADQEIVGTENGGAVLRMAGGTKADALLPTSAGLQSASMKQKQESMISIADSNIAAAAAAACMVVKALGESDLVDEKLLLEILKNPSLLKSLTCSKYFMKGRSQDHDSSPPSIRQGAPQEPQSHKLSTDHGARLNRSPVSVLARWGDGVGITNSDRLAPVVNISSHMQQSKNSSFMSMNMPPPTRLHASYPCSKSESITDLVPKAGECTPREHKQVPEIPKMNPFSHLNLNEASSTQDYGPDEMGSKNDPSKSSHDYRTQVPILATSSPFRVYPTPLPTKDLPQKHAMQVESPRYRSAEASSLPRKASAYNSFSKAGGRTKRICMYFNSSRGCRNGQSCAFVHQSLDCGVNPLAQVSAHSSPSIPL